MRIFSGYCAAAKSSEGDSKINNKVKRFMVVDDSATECISVVGGAGLGRQRVAQSCTYFLPGERLCQARDEENPLIARSVLGWSVATRDRDQFCVLS